MTVLPCRGVNQATQLRVPSPRTGRKPFASEARSFPVQFELWREREDIRMGATQVAAISGTMQFQFAETEQKKQRNTLFTSTIRRNCDDEAKEA